MRRERAALVLASNPRLAAAQVRGAAGDTGDTSTGPSPVKVGMTKQPLCEKVVG